MKSVANMLLDYAVEKRLVSTNVSRSVHGISNKKFTEPPKKEVTEQVYIDDEAKLLIDEAKLLIEEAERHYKKTIEYLLIQKQKWVNGNYIYQQRQRGILP